MADVPLVLRPVRSVGRTVIDMLRTAGGVALFAGRGLAAMVAPPWFPGQLLRQIVSVGYFSLPVVGLTAVFTGAALALIGAMRATEQIDALHTLSTDPFRYLIAPRLLATVLTMPLLVVAADIIGIAGGWTVATRTLDFNGAVYIRNTWDFIQNWDVESGLIKAAVFGFVVALMGCYHGFNAKGGARGVGRATTHAVVSAAILIFAADYLLTAAFTHK